MKKARSSTLASLSLVLGMVFSGSAPSFAAEPRNQKGFLAAVGNCDIGMAKMIADRGGVDFSDPEIMYSVFSRIPNLGDDVTQKGVDDCIATVDLCLKKGASPVTAAYPRARTPIEQFLTDTVFSGSQKFGPNDVKRAKMPTNVAVRGVKVLQTLEANGYDFRKPFITRSTDKNAPRPEAKNALMHLASSHGLTYQAAQFSRSNDPSITMMFFSWVFSNSPINAINENGKTALMMAAESQGKPSRDVFQTVVSAAPLIKIMVKDGADKSIKDKNGKTALDYAIEAGDLDAAKLLQ